MTHDVLERLREADPLRGLAPPDPASDTAVAMREAVLLGTPTSMARARRRRWVAAAVAAALAAATAAAIAVSTSRVTDPTAVGCYAGPDTTASTTVVSTTGGNPVAVCRELWEQGEIDPDVTRSDLVPPLVACVLDTAGVVGVFPAGSCDAVGKDDRDGDDALRPDRSAPGTGTAAPGADVGRPPGLDVPDFGTDDPAVRRAMDEIRLAMLDRCLDLPAATALAEEVLDRHGLQDWTVGPLLPDHPDGACSGFFPQPADQAVWFVPDDA